MMRRYFRVGAEEYYTKMQTWEAEVLFKGLAKEFEARNR
jgi:hypothetical protein